MTYHLEERQVGGEDVVEVYLRVDPRVVRLVAVRHVVDNRPVENLVVVVDALEVSPAEQVHAHDAEDEPEDETHDEHVQDGRYRLDERVHDHLRSRNSKHQTLKTSTFRMAGIAWMSAFTTT